MNVNQQIGQRGVEHPSEVVGVSEAHKHRDQEEQGHARKKEMVVFAARQDWRKLRGIAGKCRRCGHSVSET